MQSNHMLSVDVKDMPEFFQQEKYDGKSMMCKNIIDHVDAKRAINVKPEKRGEIQEVLVHNYELD